MVIPFLRRQCRGTGRVSRPLSRLWWITAIRKAVAGLPATWMFSGDHNYTKW